MSTWNEIPFDEAADAATKAREFDLQIAENARLAAERAAQAAAEAAAEQAKRGN